MSHSLLVLPPPITHTHYTCAWCIRGHGTMTQQRGPGRSPPCLVVFDLCVIHISSTFIALSIMWQRTFRR